jgi:hypothetical protein
MLDFYSYNIYFYNNDFQISATPISEGIFHFYYDLISLLLIIFILSSFTLNNYSTILELIVERLFNKNFSFPSDNEYLLLNIEYEINKESIILMFILVFFYLIRLIYLFFYDYAFHETIKVKIFFFIYSTLTVFVIIGSVSAISFAKALLKLSILGLILFYIFVTYKKTSKKDYYYVEWFKSFYKLRDFLCPNIPYYIIFVNNKNKYPIIEIIKNDSKVIYYKLFSKNKLPLKNFVAYVEKKHILSKHEQYVYSTPVTTQINHLIAFISILKCIIKSQDFDLTNNSYACMYLWVKRRMTTENEVFILDVLKNFTIAKLFAVISTNRDCLEILTRDLEESWAQFQLKKSDSIKSDLLYPLPDVDQNLIVVLDNLVNILPVLFEALDFLNKNKEIQLELFQLFSQNASFQVQYHEFHDFAKLDAFSIILIILNLNLKFNKNFYSDLTKILNSNKKTISFLCVFDLNLNISLIFETWEHPLFVPIFLLFFIITIFIFLIYKSLQKSVIKEKALIKILIFLIINLLLFYYLELELFFQEEKYLLILFRVFVGLVYVLIFFKYVKPFNTYQKTEYSFKDWFDVLEKKKKTFCPHAENYFLVFEKQNSIIRHVPMTLNIRSTITEEFYPIFYNTTALDGYQMVAFFKKTDILNINQQYIWTTPISVQLRELSNLILLLNFVFSSNDELLTEKIINILILWINHQQNNQNFPANMDNLNIIEILSIVSFNRYNLKDLLDKFKSCFLELKILENVYNSEISRCFISEEQQERLKIYDSFIKINKNIIIKTSPKRIYYTSVYTISVDVNLLQFLVKISPILLNSLYSFVNNIEKKQKLFEFLYKYDIFRKQFQNNNDFQKFAALNEWEILILTAQCFPDNNENCNIYLNSLLQILEEKN